MRSRIALVLLACGVVAAVLAQAPAPPKPGPETKKLDAFAGKWSGESEMKPGPFGPGGKYTGEDDCTWFEGGWQLVCRTTGNGPMGPMKGEGVMAWNSEEKAYKYQGFDSSGMMMTATGKNEGNTWTWTGQDKMGGKLIHSRYTIVKPTPTTQTFKWEMSEDGKTWTTVMEGKSTKK
jgi:hypothetical protein